MEKSMESFTFTVGKLDAGMAILLGERAHLIEFPSVLLPPGATAGSIVSITVHQNHAEEKRCDCEFWDLQQEIMNEFGKESPEPPPQVQFPHNGLFQSKDSLPRHLSKQATSRCNSLAHPHNYPRCTSTPNTLSVSFCAPPQARIRPTYYASGHIR
ncbi:hypothetical protein AB1N83_013801 [Pleurotus pulmonarius]